MSVQVGTDVNTRSNFLRGSFKEKSLVFAQDVGRTTDLVPMTILGQISASAKAAIMASGAVDGSQYPYAIYKGPTILAATIVAGDVTLYDCVVGGDGVIDKDSIVFDNGTDTLDTAVSGRTVESYLNDKGLFFKQVVDTEGYENA